MDKSEINQLIDRVLDELLSVSNDAGWHKGDLDPAMPAVPPRIDLADMKMINEIKWLREPHRDFAQAYAALSELPKECQDALIIKNLKRHVNDTTGRAWEDKDRAQILGITLNQFYYDLRRGYVGFEREWMKLARYEAVKKMKPKVAA